LNEAVARDVDVTFRVRSDKLAVGGAQYVYAVVRRNGNNAYRPKIILNTNGSVAVHAGVLVNNSESSVAPSVIVPGLTHTANGFIWVRSEVTGASPTTIRVKAWAGDQPEPSGWHFSATNSNAAVQIAGGVGLRAYMSSTNAPITFGFDDYRVTSGGDAPPPPPPLPPTADFSFSQQAGTLTVNFSDTSSGSPTAWSWSFGDGTSSSQQNPSKTYATAGDYSVSLTASNAGGSDSVTKQVTVVQPPSSTTYASDSFGRTVSNSWGSASTGGSYSLEGTSSNFSVGGGVGNIVLPTSGATRAALLNAVSAQDVDIAFRVRSDKLAVGGAQYVYAVARRNGGNAYRPKIILNTNGTVAVHAGVVVNNSESSVAPAVTVPGLTHTANGFIWVRAQLSGSSPTTIRVKAWADGQAEPAGWHFTATNSTAVVQTAGGVGLRAYISSTNVPITFGFDDFRVTSP
jgi:PKD repeat protein